MNKILRGLILTAVAGWAPWAAAADEPWIHVRVDDVGGTQGRVDIQVPVAMVSSLLPAMKGRHGVSSIHIDGGSIDLEQIRGYWNAVRAAKDGEYVTVRDEDSDVHVSKSGGVLRVSVDDNGRSSRVRMTVPVQLVDALLAGGDTLDLDALVGAIAKAPRGDLLTVDDEDSHVRVWIDGQPAPVREDRR
jgi:hypothetical protein